MLATSVPGHKAIAAQHGAGRPCERWPEFIRNNSADCVHDPVDDHPRSRYLDQESQSWDAIAQFLQFVWESY